MRGVPFRHAARLRDRQIVERLAFGERPQIQVADAHVPQRPDRLGAAQLLLRFGGRERVVDRGVQKREWFAQRQRVGMLPIDGRGIVRLAVGLPGNRRLGRVVVREKHAPGERGGI